MIQKQNYNYKSLIQKLIKFQDNNKIKINK